MGEYVRLTGMALRVGTGTGADGACEVLLDLGTGLILALPIAEAEGMHAALDKAIKRARERMAHAKH